MGCRRDGEVLIRWLQSHTSGGRALAPRFTDSGRARTLACNAMRFAITATDRYLGIFHALLERGWSALKVFTTPVDGRLHHHHATIELAQHLGVPVQISRLTSSDLAAL